MSEVVNAIMATKNDKVRYTQGKLFQDVFSVRQDIQQTPLLEYQYRIGVTIGSECWVTPAEIVSSKEGVDPVELAIQRTKRQVIEAIFGEFRVEIRGLERAIYNRDMEAAGVLLHNLEKKMFDVTL